MHYGKPWQTPEQLAHAIDEHICFYNECRIKLTLGGKSPTQYRHARVAQNKRKLQKVSAFPFCCSLGNALDLVRLPRGVDVF
ncbi:IS3 family transposase [Schaalia cardiffensis]|uniref:IS3 family transposase n=1 Tax=Schaalia cardiffensis TaxID=181487 RepID=UPI000A01A7EE